MRRRIAVIGGLAVALAGFGYWVSTLHSYVYQEAVGLYAGPPPEPFQPLHLVDTGVQPWAVVLVCIGLGLVWTTASLWLLRGFRRGTAD